MLDRISFDKLEIIELEKALGERVNTLILVAPWVKLFESFLLPFVGLGFYTFATTTRYVFSLWLV